MKLICRLVFAPLLFPGASAFGCELCAIYSADSARGTSSSGFLVSVSEQFTAYRVTQFEGEESPFPDPDYSTTRSRTSSPPTLSHPAWA